MQISRSFIRIVMVSIFCFASGNVSAIELNDKFTSTDAVLVSKSNGDVLFDWQSRKPLIPASLTKLVTAHLSIEKWGLKHRFSTEFLLDGQTLWVKGYGDPYLVSQELDLVALGLQKKIATQTIQTIAIDNHYFDVERAPGRSSVADSYNAPVSAVAANFNTVNLRSESGKISSAEPQTPLTPTALRQAKAVGKLIGRKPERVNLENADNAQQHFAELLMLKLGLSRAVIRINQRVPSSATLLYTHINSHTLEDVLRGSLKYSNNFIANQVFLKLPNESLTTRSFEQASEFAKQSLIKRFAWQGATLQDGSGLSRGNRLNAQQINQVLGHLAKHKTLLKPYSLGKAHGAKVFAKTGTLDGVRSFAGYISLGGSEYQFVFIFNRVVPWRYREQLLQSVIAHLAK